MAKIRWKLITIAIVFVVFAGVGVYPIVAARYGVHSPGWLMDKQLKLGLDLNGGVQLVLRVQTDDALKLETDSEMDRLRQELAKRNIPFTNLTSPDPTRFRIEGVPQAQDAAFRQASQRGAGEFRTRGGPQRHLRLHDEAEHRRESAHRGRRPGAPDDRAARQRTGRHRAEHRAAGRRSAAACSSPA